MRSAFLTTVAAAALCFGVGTAMAQSDTSGPKMPNAGPAHSTSAPKAGASDKAAMPDHARGQSAEKSRDAASPADQTGSTAAAPDKAGAQKSSDMSDAADMKNPKDGHGKKAHDAAASNHDKSNHDKANKSAASDHNGSKADHKAQQSASDHNKNAASSKNPETTGSTNPSADTMGKNADHSSAKNKPMNAKSDQANDPNAKNGKSDNQQAGADKSKHDQNAKANDHNGNDSATGKVNLSQDQRTKIEQHFSQTNVNRVKNVDFSVSVGTRVPGHVHLRSVPSTIVDVAPEFRGYDYFVAQDEIVIVKPGTRKVVEVIHRNGGGDRETTGSISSSTTISHLSSKERSSITHTLLSDNSASIAKGDTVPGCVDLRPVPQSVDVQSLRNYRYFAVGKEVVLVDPNSRKVVDILH